MNLRNNLPYIFLFICFISNCKNTNHVAITTVSSKIKDSSVILLPIATDYNTSCSEENIYVYQDSMLIIHHKADSLTKLISIYNMLRKNTVYSNFDYGASNNNLLSASISIHRDSLIVYDVIKGYVYSICIDSTIKKAHYQPKGHKSNILTQFMLPYKDALLCLNPYSFKDINTKYNNRAPRFILSTNDFQYNEKHKYKYDTFNVVNGHFIINFQRGRIVYFSRNEDYFEIFNLDKKLIKKVFGPDNIKPKYFKYDNGYSDEILYLGNIPISYISSCYSNNYIYVTYCGNRLDIKKNSDLSQYPTYIFKFDWNGNIINSYYTENYIKNISIANDERYIFSWEMNKNKELKLVKYYME